MPHINLPEGLPGILGPMAFRPESAKPLNALAEILLRGPSTLSPGERELIATFLGGQDELFLNVKRDFERTDISDKLKVLLAIAGKAQQSGKQVQAEDVERARQQGATELEIHDTVLIVAPFCMV
jgi:alkylhydroperoxidase/carboxymuconolactone decarboxylase family protein YurZ